MTGEPIIFEAQIVGAVTPTKDRGIKHSVLSVYEVPDETYNRLCELRRSGERVFVAIVMGAAEIGSVPELPSASAALPPVSEQPKPRNGKKEFSKSQCLRFAIEENAAERGLTGKEQTEPFYDRRMDEFTREVKAETEMLRRDKAYNGRPGF